MMWPIVVTLSLLLMQGVGSLGDVPGNLLINPRADLGGEAWRSAGDATVERRDGNPSFVVRNQGGFQQIVDIPHAQGSRYAVFLARASSERINADGSITGLPYLYGMMRGERGRILAHLQGQGMRSQARKPEEWSTLWGAFQVPEGTVAILFQLSQGERRGDPQNGSAARFDDAVLVLVPTLDEANALVQKYR